MKQVKTYEHYKDSGIEWIGKIPKEWKITKVKKYFQLINGATPESSNEAYWDGDIPWATPLDLSNLDNCEIYDTGRKITQEGYDNCGTTIVKEGSIIMASRAPIGYVSIIKKPLCFNQGCKALEKIKEINARYEFYFLKSYENVLTSRGRGTTFMELPNKELSIFPIAFPSLVEQEKITDFLDEKTKKIDIVTSNKRKQMELLAEYEQTILNEAVSAGLNKKAELKNSEIEWFGKIPKIWNVERLKYVADLKFSNVDKKSEDGEEGVLACNYIDVYKNNYITHKIDFMKITASEEEINKFSIKKGDILATKDSEEPEDIAIPSFVSEDFEKVVCGYHLAMIRPSNKFVARYLFRLFQSRDFNIRFTIFAKGVTRFGLDMNIFKDARVPMPPISEQQKIADYLDEKTSKIRESIELIEREVEKLEEYKKILINEAVTGKIKVF